MNLESMNWGEIIFSNVTFDFAGRSILDGFSERVVSGEKICLVGESGSGKTTLMNSLLGVVVPSSGEVSIAGEIISPTTISHVRSQLVWVPQSIELPSEQSVEQTLKAPFEFVVNRDKRFDRQRAVHLMQRVGLSEEMMAMDVCSLSGGERQRVLLVGALLLDRKIMLLDEPTSALDAMNRDRVIELLCSLEQTTIVAISHDEIFARSMDRVIELKRQ